MKVHNNTFPESSMTSWENKSGWIIARIPANYTISYSSKVSMFITYNIKEQL